MRKRRQNFFYIFTMSVELLKSGIGPLKIEKKLSIDRILIFIQLILILVVCANYFEEIKPLTNSLFDRYIGLFIEAAKFWYFLTRIGAVLKEIIFLLNLSKIGERKINIWSPLKIMTMYYELRRIYLLTRVRNNVGWQSIIKNYYFVNFFNHLPLWVKTIKLGKRETQQTSNPRKLRGEMPLWLYA